jgi:LCP family protein required for cell wall assembly
MNPRNQQSLDGVRNRRRLTDYQPLHAPTSSGKPASGLSPSGITRLEDAKRQFDSTLSAVQSQREIDTPKKRFRKKQPVSRFKRIAKLSSAFMAIALLFFGVKALIALQRITERNFGQGALALQDNIDPSQLQKEGDGRVNVLAIGIGGEDHPGGQLADTILVISIDPFNNEAAMVSLPRDFYLRVPGHYSSRINAVHAMGESSGKNQGGGPKLLSDTVEQVLDIDIHYYVRVDFDGFVKAVDTVGGIDVDVKERLYDGATELIYKDFGGPRFSYEPGRHHLDGKRALQFARCRKSTSCGSDFGRAARQQQVIVSLKDKVLSIPTLTNPLKVVGLLDAAGSHARTNIDIRNELPKFMEIAKRIDSANIRNFVFSNAPGGLLSSRTIGGAYVLVPQAGLDNFTRIQQFVHSDIFRDGFLKKENAKITIMNGTSKAGFATRTAEYLKGYGYDVVKITDAPVKTSETIIYDQTNGQKPFTMALLEKRMKKPIQSGAPAGTTSSSDIIIVLGDDFALTDE